MENLIFNNKTQQWEYGCGCGGKKKEIVTPPANSRAILIRKYTTLTGPITGIQYAVTPGQVSIDIDAQDAEAWLKDGTATVALPNQRGRTTRIGKEKKANLSSK